MGLTRNFSSSNLKRFSPNAAQCGNLPAPESGVGRLLQVGQGFRLGNQADDIGGLSLGYAF
jgi:hypothetical protein